ncbi:Ras-responsive element-binding protein 1 [Holothuria leucospilota]|uniref:Ras-responsive element-binding protein 1 n=1 Tax=Holothuria leucospilota TaxID=206669 RepID=A0A9Q1CAM1_HOLLE|nr:Ras-responsive element-binding protein 1 [Holothuria leucospilota]
MVDAIHEVHNSQNSPSEQYATTVVTETEDVVELPRDDDNTVLKADEEPLADLPHPVNEDCEKFWDQHEVPEEMAECVKQENEDTEGGAMNLSPSKTDADFETDATGDAIKMEPSDNETEVKTKRRRPMETPEVFMCQLCHISFENPRDLTVHIRGHNEASSHTCNICSKKLSSASSLDRHMLIHSGERPFQCPMCEMSFTTNGNMNRHLRTHEKGQKDDLLQSKCDKTQGLLPGSEGNDFLTSSQCSPSKRPKLGSKQHFLSGNVKSQGGGLSADDDITCPVCHKTFICRFGLETHMTFHPDMKLTCVFCNVSFRSQRGLRMHLYKVHKEDNLTGDSVLYRSPESSPWKTITGIDGVCFAEFSTKKFPHIAQVWCEENSPSVKGDERSHVCLECKKVFPCMEALNLHQSSTHGDKRRGLIPAVKENAVSAKYKRKLKDHILSQDSRNTFNLGKSSPKDNFMNALSLQPTRAECEDTFHRNGSPILNGILSYESKSAQMSSKLGKCARQRVVNTEGLWKGFPVLDDMSPSKEGRSGRPQPQSFSPLKAEMATGAPKKPFVETDKSFVDLHEGNKGVGPLSRRQESEPISADVGVGMLTPAEFATANSHVDMDELERERALTEGSDLWNDRSCTKKCSHTCKFCGKAFPFRSTLKVHVRSHMGLTPYKCMLCDYSSADKSTLVRHMRTHSGERPYSCKLCGFPFTTKANCERHVRKRHGKISKLDIDVNIQHHPLQRLPEQGQFSSPDTICRVCNRDFKFFRDLQNHMRIHEKSPNKLYACVKCNMNFAKKNQCVRHMLRKHRHLSSSEIQQHVQSLSEKEDKAKEGKISGKHFKEDGLSTFKDLPFSSQANLSGLPRPVPVYVNTGYQVFPADVQDEPLDLSLPKSRSTPPVLSPNKPSSSRHFPQFGSSATVIPFSRENVTFNMDGASRYKEPYKKFYSPLLDALVCPHCLRLFKKGSRLKTHIRSHTKERPFRCSMCSAAFTQSSSLDEHMIRRHYEEEDPGMEQNEIKYGITPMQIKLKHRDQTTSSILKNCLQSKDSQDKKSVMEGACTVGGKIGRSTGTPPNGPSSDSSIELSSVSKMIAATNSNNFQQYMPSQIIRQTVGDPQSYQRSLKLAESPTDLSMSEDNVFSHEGNLVIAENQESVDVASEGDSRENGEDYDTEELLKMSRSSKLESRQTCPYCQRKFPWVSSLRRHLITHTGLKPYECPHCGATFSTKSNCERHINRRHQGQKNGEEELEMVQKDPFKCKECNEAAFSTRRKLQRHYREEHPMVSFPQEYMDAPDVIVNNKDLIEKIQQGYDPVLSPSVSGIIPEGTKKRNQLFFGSHSSAIKQEPVDHHLAEKSCKDISSVGTSNMLYEQKADRFLSTQEVECVPSEREDASPFLLKDAEPKSIVIKQEAQLSPHPSSVSAVENSSDLMSAESFSDQAISEDDNGENSEDDSQVSGSEDQSNSSLVMIPSSSPSLVVPQVTLTTKKGKKGARFNCDQCCKRFKTAQTLLRHLKVHQLEHPFKCTECTATFTTKFNCQRHIMKLHGKSKEEVMNITGTGKGTSSKIMNNSSVNKTSPKKIKVNPNSPLLVYSHVNATNIGLGRSVVKVSPKQRKTPIGSLPGKKNLKGKIKNLLPSVQYYDRLEAKSPSFVDGARVSNMTSFQSQAEEEGHGAAVIAGREGDVSNVGDGDSINWKYRYNDTSSPGLEGVAATSSEGMPNESIENSGAGMLGEGSVSNSDIIKDLLGIPDSSTMDQLLESADSAAKILGVQS